jgi:hypothetical protein
MADLLASLEAGFSERTHIGAAFRLRNQILVIDKFIADQRKINFPLPQPTPSSHRPTQNLSRGQNPFSRPIPTHALPNVRNTPNSATHNRSIIARLSSVNDANIDPALQSVASPSGAATINPTTGPMSGGMYQTGIGPDGTFDYLARSTVPGDMNGTGGMNVAAVGEQFQFQIPAELLKDWPWPFHVPSGRFGGFDHGV